MIHEKRQNIDINRDLEEVDSNLMNDYEEFKIFSAVVKIARELELEMEPEDVNELLQSHDQTWTDEELTLMEEEMWFLKMKPSPSEDAMMIFGMTTKDLEYQVNLIDTAAAEFERIASSLEKNPSG